jgi:hypothetical protein
LNLQFAAGQDGFRPPRQRAPQRPNSGLSGRLSGSQVHLRATKATEPDTPEQGSPPPLRQPVWGKSSRSLSSIARVALTPEPLTPADHQAPSASIARRSHFHDPWQLDSETIRPALDQPPPPPCAMSHCLFLPRLLQNNERRNICRLLLLKKCPCSRPGERAPMQGNESSTVADAPLLETPARHLATMQRRAYQYIHPSFALSSPCRRLRCILGPNMSPFPGNLRPGGSEAAPTQSLPLCLVFCLFSRCEKSVRK